MANLFFQNTLSNIQTPSLSQRVCLFTVFNIVITIVNSYGYILASGYSYSTMAIVFAHLALLAQVLLISSGIGLITLFGVLILRQFTFVASWLAGFLFACFHSLIFLDRSIFAIYKYHVNGLVLNVLSSYEGLASLGLSHFDFLLFFTIFIIVWLLETLVFYIVVFKAEGSVNRLAAKVKWGKNFVFIFSLMFTEKIIYATSDLVNHREIISTGKMIPWYQPATIKKLVTRFTDYRVDKDLTKTLTAPKNLHLTYPHGALAFEQPQKQYNFLWIIIDCLRYRNFNAKNTPHTWTLAKEGLTFHNHFSGGNASRHGFFSMFYGVWGSYWPTFLAERIQSVLFDRFKQLNYNLAIFASTSLSFPEFRQTVFSGVNDFIYDDLLAKGSAAKDRMQVDLFEQRLASLKPDDRHFTVLYFDSAHAPYQFDEDRVAFRPFIKAQFADKGDSDKVLGVYNSYRNALYYLDGLVGQALESLKRNHFYDDTVILITGDHGEEFYEHGFWGHSSAFTPEQIHVPLILKVPGVNPQNIVRETSHHDLVPTLMDMLGSKSDYRDYSMGQSLLTDTKRNYLISCGWDNCAAILPQGYMVFGTEGYNPYGIQFFDTDYNEITDKKRQDFIKPNILVEIMEGMARFYK